MSTKDILDGLGGARRSVQTPADGVGDVGSGGGGGLDVEMDAADEGHVSPLGAPGVCAFAHFLQYGPCSGGIKGDCEIYNCGAHRFAALGGKVCCGGGAGLTGCSNRLSEDTIDLTKNIAGGPQRLCASCLTDLAAAFLRTGGGSDVGVCAKKVSKLPPQLSALGGRTGVRIVQNFRPPAVPVLNDVMTSLFESREGKTEDNAGNNRFSIFDADFDDLSNKNKGMLPFIIVIKGGIDHDKVNAVVEGAAEARAESALLDFMKAEAKPAGTASGGPQNSTVMFNNCHILADEVGWKFPSIDQYGCPEPGTNQRKGTEAVRLSLGEEMLRNPMGTLSRLFLQDNLIRRMSRLDINLSRWEMRKGVQYLLGTGGLSTHAFVPFYLPADSVEFFDSAPEEFPRDPKYFAHTFEILETQTRQMAEVLVALGWPQYMGLSILLLLPVFKQRCHQLDILNMPDVVDALWNLNLRDYSARCLDRYTQGGYWTRATPEGARSWYGKTIAERNLIDDLGLPPRLAIPLPVPSDTMQDAVTSAFRAQHVSTVHKGLLHSMSGALGARTPITSLMAPITNFASQFAVAAVSRASVGGTAAAESVIIHTHPNSPLSVGSLQGGLVCHHYVKSLAVGNGHCPLGSICPHLHVSRCLRGATCKGIGKPSKGTARTVESTCGSLHEWEITLFS
jgi:hypothetical protein